MTGTAGTGTEPSDYAAARLRLLQEGAWSGPTSRAALSQLTDEWLAALLAAAVSDGHLSAVALVAVGGYGRGELSPRSDLDLLLLHDGSGEPRQVAALADRIWYPIWDLGLALDHSVRTLEEVRRTAAEDVKVQLGVLDARHVAGDAELTAELRTTMLAQWRAQASKRLPELREMGQERARRQGELSFLLEPDLKEACGGLRDATALRAVAASWLADAPRQGLAEARGVLLDTRDALQLTTGRATDRLSLHDQDQVAAALDLLDADALLRQVYEAARTIAYASEVTWREVGRVLRSRSGRPRLRGLLSAPLPRSRAHRAGGRAVTPGERAPLAEGVVEQEGEVVLARTARPDRDPVLVLRAAAAAALAGLPLALPAVRRLANSCRGLPVPWPAEAREQFVTLLGAGVATVPVWEALEAEGLITRLLPDWERVRCRPQRNAVHRWTVDRHLVETAVCASGFARRVHRPDLLLVAALLHDIGKGWPGDHSVVGETITYDLARRMGFDSGDVTVLATLVRHHLLLIETATRRDLDDPATVRWVADRVGDPGTLELLHALTEADALATGPAAWSAWRRHLVADLVTRVAAVLAGNPPVEPGEAVGPSAEQERLAFEAWRTGAPVLALHARSETSATSSTAPQSPSIDVRDPASLSRGEAGNPELDVGDRGAEPVGVELVIALPDQPGVLSAVAGTLALHRLAVRTADLRTLTLPATALTAADGRPGTGPGAGAEVLLLNWRVAAEYGGLPHAERLRADLSRALDGSLDLPARLAEREEALRRRRWRRGPQAPPPQVTVAAAGSQLATVIEVRAQDAPGMLHRIGRALEDAAVRVRSARVSTWGANAVDAFYVTGVEGSPLAPPRATQVAREVERRLGG